jgi:two-component system KDP operon response regulator KdpE
MPMPQFAETHPILTRSRTPVGAPADVLVVGRRRRLAVLVRAALSGEGHSLRFAADEEAAVDALFTAAPDAVLVLADDAAQGAVDLCHTVRTAANPAILIVAESASVAERVAGLACADDYVTLPVAPAELAARLAAVLRRTAPCREAGRAVFDDGTLRVDLGARVVTLGDGPVDLTPTEYRMLALLLSNAGRVFTHEQILQRVWSSAFAGDSHLLRLHVANLRAKIDLPQAPSYIETHRGVGYAFAARRDGSRRPPPA